MSDADRIIGKIRGGLNNAKSFWTGVAKVLGFPLVSVDSTTTEYEIPDDGNVLVAVQTATGDGPYTVTLPVAPQAGQRVIIKDAGGAADTDSLTIDLNGHTVEGNAANIVIADPWDFRYLMYDGAQWLLIVTGVTSGVKSVFGRTGDVTAQSGDYDAEQVDYDNQSSGLAAADVQTAIDELDDRVDDLENADGVPASRTLTAGAGLTGGGDLSADRTFDVVAHADGSIVVNADNIQVGVLASDAQHGERGGGTQHALATDAVAGFMSAADKDKLDGIEAGAQVNDPDLVTSVHGRDGDVVAASGDYDAEQIDYDNGTSGLTATDVQAAIDELAADAGGGGGSGDVVGPDSATDHAVARWDGATGKLLQDSTVLLNDDGQLSAVKSLSYTTEHDKGSVSGAVTVDWSDDGEHQKLTLSGDATLSFTDPPGVSKVVLRIAQDGTGSRTVTWPGSVNWPDGAPTLKTDPGGVDVFLFYFDGSNYHPFGRGSGGATITRWHGPYGLSQQMRDQSSALFLWRAQPELVADDFDGAIDVSRDADYWEGRDDIELVCDASPRHIDAQGIGGLYWDTAAPITAAVKMTSGASSCLVWPNSTDLIDFDALINSGVFTILIRFVPREDWSTGTHYLLHNKGSGAAGFFFGADSGNLVFQVYDSTPTTVVDLSAAVSFSADELVTVAVVGDGTNVRLLQEDLETPADTAAYVAAGSPTANQNLIMNAIAGVGVGLSDLSVVGIVMLAETATPAELVDWESWTDGTDYSDVAPDAGGGGEGSVTGTVMTHADGIQGWYPMLFSTDLDITSYVSAVGDDAAMVMTHDWSIVE